MLDEKKAKELEGRGGAEMCIGAMGRLYGRITGRGSESFQKGE